MNAFPRHGAATSGPPGIGTGADNATSGPEAIGCAIAPAISIISRAGTNAAGTGKSSMVTGPAATMDAIADRAIMATVDVADQIVTTVTEDMAGMTGMTGAMATAAKKLRQCF